MLDIMDYYGRQRALCGGSLGPLKNLGWAFAHPRFGLDFDMLILFLRLCLDVYVLVWISGFQPDFYEFLWISMLHLWFPRIRLDFNVVLMISRGLFFISKY